MLFVMLSLVALFLVFAVAAKKRDRISERYPAFKKPLATASKASVALVWAALAYGVYWINTRPESPPPHPDPLPAKIRPPAIEGAAWTVYDRSAKDKSQFALDLASRDLDDDRALVWKRYDDLEKGSMILSLTRYGCRTGKRADIYDVYYEKGIYSGFDENDQKDEENVDLESVDGAGFLLACFGKMPSVIDDD